ncbi:hypothetical protein LFADAHJC_LOCUS2272 [Methylorubrum extorquens]
MDVVESNLKQAWLYHWMSRNICRISHAVFANNLCCMQYRFFILS